MNTDTSNVIDIYNMRSPYENMLSPNNNNSPIFHKFRDDDQSGPSSSQTNSTNLLDQGPILSQSLNLSDQGPIFPDQGPNSKSNKKEKKDSVEILKSAFPGGTPIISYVNGRQVVKIHYDHEIVFPQKSLPNSSFSVSSVQSSGSIISENTRSSRASQSSGITRSSRASQISGITRSSRPLQTSGNTQTSGYPQSGPILQNVDEYPKVYPLDQQRTIDSVIQELKKAAWYYDPAASKNELENHVKHDISKKFVACIVKKNGEFVKENFSKFIHIMEEYDIWKIVSNGNEYVGKFIQENSCMYLFAESKERLTNEIANFARDLKIYSSTLPYGQFKRKMEYHDTDPDSD